MIFKRKIVNNLPEDWLVKEEYSKIIKKEINLSFRTGLPLSLISIDLSKIKTLKCNAKEKHYLNVFDFLIRFISDNMRQEDIKCYREEGIIDILLINTGMEGAAVISKKISDNLLRNFNKQHFIDIIKNISFNKHLLNQLANKSDENKTSDFTPLSSSIEKHTNLFMADDEDFAPHKNIDVNIFPNGLLSIANTYSLESSWDIRGKIFLSTKRIMDLAFTIFNLVFFSPLILIIAIVIKLSSEGPVLFKQQRYGQYKIPFTFYKFRTMKVNNDDNVHREYVKSLIQGKNDQVNLGTDDNPFYKIKNDKRITRIGKFLRNTSLDELPQFLNVLKGDMSIVGPRPPLLYEVESYKNWHLQRVLSVKPGITGLWQVSGKNKTTFDEMVRLDLQYIKNRSAFLDMKIMFKTLPAMLNEG